MKNIVNIVLVLVGLGLLGFGGYRQFAAPQVSDADRARCESAVHAQNEGNAEVIATLLPQCSDVGMIAMMDAQAQGLDAQATAQRIGSANQADLRGMMVDYAMISAGLALLVGGLLGRRRRAV